jgi:glyoxylase-like metal-dependent hydrolase (beta-lactamase superfamily II)
MQRITLGDFELISVTDGIYRLDGGAFFGVIPKVMWSKKVTADGSNYVAAGLNSVVVRTGEKTVLIETGIGNRLPEKMAKIYGQPAKLLDNLEAAGVDPAEIDVVINTHLHFDHCGWNMVERGGKLVATFPKAQYYVQEDEWQYAQRPSERDGVSYMTNNYDPLVASRQMQLLRGNQEIVPGISVRVFPGHTQNMQAVILRSGGKTACYISDLIPTSAHIDLNWVMAFDLFPLQSLESRKRYYAEAMAGRWLTMFTHDPNMPWGYIEKDAKGKMAVRTG